MCAANEVTLVNTVYGADRNALCATCAERIVNNCKIVHNLNSSARTSLLALHTANTAVGAVLTCKRTLIAIGAFNYYSRGIVDKMNNRVGALTNANSTTDTLARIDSCYAVFDSDSAPGTYRNTVTVAKTRKSADLVAAIYHISGTAGVQTAILILLLCSLAGSVTGNVGNLLNNVHSLNSEDSGNFSCGIVTAGNT